jgi:hypothetical protein
MNVEIVVPQSTVTISPGVETRVRIQVSNNGDERMPVRIGVVRGRAAGWAQVEPAVVAAGPGESTSVDIVFRPPASATPQATLQPFTVQAEDLTTGFVAARATGLLAVMAPRVLTASLAVSRVRRRAVTVVVTVENSGSTPMTLGVRPAVEMIGESAKLQGKAASKAAAKAARRATAKPSLLEIAAGSSSEAKVVGRPKRAVFGARRPYVLTVRCVDVADETAVKLANSSALPRSTTASEPDAEPSPTAPGPLATVTHAGIAKARMSRPTATIIGLLIVGSLTAGGVWVARMGVLPDQITRFTAGRLGGSKAPTEPVKAPYALVDVFPIGSRNAAEAARDRLNSAGMGVRVVDSRESGVIADGPEGFHVLIRDGFSRPEAVQAYCDQYKVIAPNCQVVLS